MKERGGSTCVQAAELFPGDNSADDKHPNIRSPVHRFRPSVCLFGEWDFCNYINGICTFEKL